MSEEEQQPQAGAGEDLLPMIGQSQLYTATEDTLFTKNIPALSKTHSLVSMSHYYPTKEFILFKCIYLYYKLPSQRVCQPPTRQLW